MRKTWNYICSGRRNVSVIFLFAAQEEGYISIETSSVVIKLILKIITFQAGISTVYRNSFLIVISFINSIKSRF